MRCIRCLSLWIFAALVVAALGFFGSAEAASATLSWTDNSTNELGFEIERKGALCAVVGQWNVLGTVAANVSTYTDATVVDGNKYCFRLRAWNKEYTDGSGNTQYSAYSNEAEYARPFPVPASPAQLQVTGTP